MHIVRSRNHKKNELKIDVLVSPFCGGLSCDDSAASLAREPFPILGFGIPALTR